MKVNKLFNRVVDGYDTYCTMVDDEATHWPHVEAHGKRVYVGARSCWRQMKASDKDYALQLRILGGFIKELQDQGMHL